jgi:hypothetical protein
MPTIVAPPKDDQQQGTLIAVTPRRKRGKAFSIATFLAIVKTLRGCGGGRQGAQGGSHHALMGGQAPEKEAPHPEEGRMALPVRGGLDCSTSLGPSSTLTRCVVVRPRLL